MAIKEYIIQWGHVISYLYSRPQVAYDLQVKFVD